MILDREVYTPPYIRRAFSSLPEILYRGVQTRL
jgi:hypothetical protein